VYEAVKIMPSEEYLMWLPNMLRQSSCGECEDTAKFPCEDQVKKSVSHCPKDSMDDKTIRRLRQKAKK